MSHIEDRWVRTVVGPDGRPVKRIALAMTPEAAVETGRKDHARMRAEGDSPDEEEAADRE